MTRPLSPSTAPGQLFVTPKITVSSPASLPNVLASSVRSDSQALLQDDEQSRVQSPTLESWLRKGPFVLSLAPGFFGFYAHIGALVALEEARLLDGVSHATGASAGALIAGLFAAGRSPREMGEDVIKFRRSDFWDPVGFGGVLRGRKFEELIEASLPEGVRTFDQCRVPLYVSGFDLSRLQTRSISEGDIAPALRASCTFPMLFSPVWHSQGVLVDGGVQDTTGMWCIPEDCQRVLNISFGRRNNSKVCVPPSRFRARSNTRSCNSVEIVSLVLEGLPRPSPFAMERGASALEAARMQVQNVIGLPLLPGAEESHWVAPTFPWPQGGNTFTPRAGAGTGSKRKRAFGREGDAAHESTVAVKEEMGQGGGGRGKKSRTGVPTLLQGSNASGGNQDGGGGALGPQGW